MPTGISEDEAARDLSSRLESDLRSLERSAGPTHGLVLVATWQSINPHLTALSVLVRLSDGSVHVLDGARTIGTAVDVHVCAAWLDRESSERGLAPVVLDRVTSPLVLADPRALEARLEADLHALTGSLGRPAFGGLHVDWQLPARTRGFWEIGLEVGGTGRSVVLLNDASVRSPQGLGSPAALAVARAVGAHMGLAVQEREWQD